MYDLVLKICQGLGYDFNIVEFVVCDGVLIVIDFCNFVFDVDINLVGVENFEWVVEMVVIFVIEKVKVQKDGVSNLIWGNFICNFVVVIKFKVK